MNFRAAGPLEGLSSAMRLRLFGSENGVGVSLEQGRIYLRPARRSDWKAWAELRQKSRAFLTPWEPTWSHDALGRESYRRRLRQYRFEWDQETGYSFFIFRRDDDALLGGITLSNVRRGVAQTGNLGYWIGQPYARLGYMAEAVEAILGFAFEELGLHRLEAACLLNNEASQGLLKKLGFREHGLARQYLKINGKWQDHLLFEILRNESPLNQTA